MQVFLWIKETDLLELDGLIRDRNRELEKKSQIKVFNEKVLPNSILVSISLEDFINLDDREVIRKIY